MVNGSSNFFSFVKTTVAVKDTPGYHGYNTQFVTNFKHNRKPE